MFLWGDLFCWWFLLVWLFCFVVLVWVGLGCLFIVYLVLSAIPKCHSFLIIHFPKSVLYKAANNINVATNANTAATMYKTKIGSCSWGRYESHELVGGLGRLVESQTMATTNPIKPPTAPPQTTSQPRCLRIISCIIFFTCTGVSSSSRWSTTCST